MQQEWTYFDEKRPAYTVETFGKGTEHEHGLVTFYDPAPEEVVKTDEGERIVYPYTVRFLPIEGETAQLETRVANNQDRYHDAACEYMRRAQFASIQAPTILELTETLLEQECRIAMLEMGVSL